MWTLVREAPGLPILVSEDDDRVSEDVVLEGFLVALLDLFCYSKRIPRAAHVIVEVAPKHRLCLLRLRGCTRFVHALDDQPAARNGAGSYQYRASVCCESLV